MRNQTYVMRDPTAEISPVLRERLPRGKICRKRQSGCYQYRRNEATSSWMRWRRTYRIKA